MSNLTNHAEDAILDWVLGGANPTRPTTRYVALHTADPTEVGNVGEVGAGVGYARQAATFAASSGSAVSNVADIEFGPATGAGFGTVSHVSIWDHATAGNCWWKGPLSAAKAIDAGDVFIIPAGDLDLSAD